MTVKRALISVSDKTGVIEFAKELAAMDIKIISSGGTAKLLQEHKIPCREISDVTGFPEILDGRVKTLHPKIHGGILARRSIKGHVSELEKHDIEAIDLVVVNLYPFEATLSRVISDKNYDPAGEIPEKIVENIDIGGVTLLRAAAKNFNDVLVICLPEDYKPILEKMKAGSITPRLRRELAAKAFRHTAYYDSLISGFFSEEKFPEQTTIPLRKLSGLRYGENPHQQASVYRLGNEINKPVAVTSKQLQGKELSYNNYLDLESSWRLVHEFESPACAIIKHNNPCGCAEGKDILDAYTKALACDTASAYGGIIAFNRDVDEATANEVKKLFTECIIAPAYSDEAKKSFSEKKNLRLLEQPVKPVKTAQKNDIEYRSVSGGMLVQDRDTQLLTETKTITKEKPSSEMLDSLQFAWKICKHVKSNAIILVRGKQAVGIGAGQMSRIDSLKIAAEKMKAVDAASIPASSPLVLASDAFFPFPDVVNESSKIGVKAIIQPGGSIRDEESIKAADGHGMAMVFTGMRHFRH